MLIQDFSVLKASILRYREQARSMAIRKNVNLIVCEDEKAVYADVLTEVIADYLLHGVYSTKKLLEDDMLRAIYDLIDTPTEPGLKALRSRLKRAYREEPRYKGEYVIRQLVYNQMDQNTDVSATIKNYFMIPDEKSVAEILSMLEKR